MSLGGNPLTYLSSLLALAGIWLIAVISPGPNFVTTVHHAVSRSRRDGVLVALGVATATTVWVIVSLVGLEVLLARLSWLVDIIRLIGSLYLFFLGGKMIWLAHRQTRAQEFKHSSTTTAHHSPWFIGFLTNITNPKTAAFFGSLFAILLPAHPLVWSYITCVVTMVLISVCWYSLVACAFSFGPIARSYLRIKKWIDTASGGILLVMGIRLAVSK